MNKTTSRLPSFYVAMLVYRRVTVSRYWKFRETLEKKIIFMLHPPSSILHPIASALSLIFLQRCGWNKPFFKSDPGNPYEILWYQPSHGGLADYKLSEASYTNQHQRCECLSNFDCYLCSWETISETWEISNGWMQNQHQTSSWNQGIWCSQLKRRSQYVTYVCTK